MLQPTLQYAYLTRDCHCKQRGSRLHNPWLVVILPHPIIPANSIYCHTTRLAPYSSKSHNKAKQTKMKTTSILRHAPYFLIFLRSLSVALRSQPLPTEYQEDIPHDLHSSSRSMATFSPLAGAVAVAVDSRPSLEDSDLEIPSQDMPTMADTIPKSVACQLAAPTSAPV